MSADFEQRLARLESLMSSSSGLNSSSTLEALTAATTAAEAGDTAFVLLSVVFIMLMQLGFAMLECGAVRENNVVTTYAKNFLDVIVAALSATLWAYTLAYDEVVLMQATGSLAFSHFVSFQAAASTIISGAVAERITTSAYLLVSLLLSGLIFPLQVRFAWAEGGFLQALGFHDFAGSGVVHITGGAAAFVGACILGPRSDRWDPAMAGDFVASNVPKVLEGTLLLWVAWYGFNAGSTAAMHNALHARTAAHTTVTTTISAATGGVVAGAMTMKRYRQHHFVGISAIANGILAGLVGITAGCDSIRLALALAVGAVAAVVMVLASRSRVALRVDDCVGASEVHFAAGVWGLLAVGLFNEEEGLLLGGGGRLLGVQTLGALTIVTCSALATGALCAGLRAVGWLRMSELEERTGADPVTFGMRAYVQHTEVLRRYRYLHAMLDEQGMRPAQLLDALTSLRTIIMQPFTPQAADNKIEGEVRDILEHLKFGHDAEQSSEHLGFISHHKRDGGEAARILRDTALRVAAEMVDDSDYRDTLQADLQTERTRKPSSRKSSRKGRPSLSASVHRLQSMVKLSGRKTPGASDKDVFASVATEPTANVATGSIATDGGAASVASATVGASPPSSPPSPPPSPPPPSPSQSPRDSAQTPRGARWLAGNVSGNSSSILKRASQTIAGRDLFFLDSSNLYDVRELGLLVHKSANYVLLLTRDVLTRPAVLVEVCAAHLAGKRIIVVMVNFPGMLGGQVDERQFIFPNHLEQAIEELGWCIIHEGRPPTWTYHAQKAWRLGPAPLRRIFSGSARRKGGK